MLCRFGTEEYNQARSSSQKKEQKPFTGYAKFLNTGKSERFFACDGQYITLYSTAGTWKRLYSIELVAPPKLQPVPSDAELPLLAKLHAANEREEPRTAAKEELERLIDDRSRLARFAVESAQGEYFLWHKGWNVSVWHLKLGSMVSYIYLELGLWGKKRLSESDMKAAALEKVEFLYSDHDTIALRVVVTKPFNEDMAILFAAETGRELSSVSLSEVPRGGVETKTPARMLDQFFDLHSDGCTLRMPALPGSNTGNMMRALMLETDGQYGIYQKSFHIPTSDNPTFITLRQGPSLKIRRIEGPTSVPDIAGSCDCSPKCCPTKKPIGNSGSSQIAIMPDRPPVVIETKTDTGASKSLLEVNLSPGENAPRNFLRMELEGSESINYFPELWVMTIQGPAHLSIWDLPADKKGNCKLLLHWEGFPIASFTKMELRVDVPCVQKREIKYWNKKYNKGCPFLIPLDDYKVCSKENAELFVGGVQDIADWFTKSKESTFKDAIIRYLGNHVNSTPVPSDDSKSTMFLLCSRINENVNLKHAANCPGIKDLVTGLILSDAWIPQEKYSKGHNPLDVVFKKLGENPNEEDDVLVIAEEIVRWCHKRATNEDRDEFIYILLECMPDILRISRRRPEMVVIADKIIQRCYKQALLQNRPENLNYLIKCMPELQALYPRIALKVSRRFAYFPARFRQVIIDNHTISNPPFLSKFSSSEPLQIYDCKNPTLQFRHDPKKPDKDRDYFREEVFVAPFSLLWSIKNSDNPDKTKGPSSASIKSDRISKELSSLSIMEFDKPDKKEPNPFPTKAPVATESATKRKMRYDSDFLMVRKSDETSWWKSLLHLIPSQIIPLQHIYVRPRYYQLEILDNPAIEALVEYKWNTIGYLLWLARFSTQCIYYSLIVIAAFMQVYFKDPTVLRYVFVAIIVLAFWFLVQEIRQFSQSVKEVLQIRSSKIFSKRQWYRRPYVPRYLKSQYNVLDLLAFTFPMAASFIQLDNINENNPLRAGWLLSFSLIIVFLHMLAELRVIRVVCKYVTIILRIFSEIQVFFAVFALGILFFSLAIEHILRGRAIGDFPVSMNGTDTSNSTSADGIIFPRHFLAAITSTFFIMGGRYEPVANELSREENWALHIMIVIYFFFTVILMLNVLIALLNIGFSKADGDWHLVWLENRLRYVESAENMSYRIPGFRQTYDWFPREIYYTATPEQVQQYNERMPQDEEETGSYESTLDNTHKSRVPNPDAMIQKNVKDHLNTFQKQMDDQMKKHLDGFLKQIKVNQSVMSPTTDVD
ncbi:hypothetical protein BG006_009532 [Podila minutissima]|uniref:Ion transport domain-containing protein n=1 Tax=Podila minutissima TaxID=64525 RepID=A0A9P5SUB3_9FUNG|nr:hypothetical protein BG006_009532 [Podila minutissima]